MLSLLPPTLLSLLHHGSKFGAAEQRHRNSLGMSHHSKGGNRSGGWGAGSPGWGDGQDWWNDAGWGKAGWGSPGWGDGQDWWNDGKGGGGGAKNRGGGGGAKNRSGGQGAGSSSSAAGAAAAAPAAPTAAAALAPPREGAPAAPAVIHHPAAWFQEEINGQIHWDLAHFQSCPSWVDTYRQHNAALKWFRQEFESAVAGQSMVLPNSCEIPAIVKGQGMDWDFNPAVLVKWSWHEMVAQLDAESMRVVVEGDAGRSGGLIRCELLPRPGFRYDHKRHHQLKDAGRAERNTQLRVWDFVLTRDDGSGLRLHPQWSSTKVETYAVEGGEGLQVPRAGLGESDGPGTYRRYKEAGNQRSLRFDATKRPR